MSDTANDATAQSRPFQFTLIQLLAFTAIIATFCLLAVRGCDISRLDNPAERSRCRQQLQTLGAALLKYEIDHGHFPKAIEGGRNGESQFSWRIEMLPAIEGGDAGYKLYKKNEPWGGPNNTRFKTTTVSYFHCFCDEDSLLTMASYVAVVGPHSAWSPDRALTKDDFPDGLENTILLVEVPNSGIYWAEPRDITVEQFRAWFQKLKDDPSLCLHRGGVNVLLGDGSAITLPPKLDLETLDALLTRDGGEKIDMSRFR